MPRKTHSTLGIAFVLSLLLHAALVPLARLPAEPQAEETPAPVALETPSPTPLPTPAPIRTPAPTPSPIATPKPLRRATPLPHHAFHSRPHRRPVTIAHQLTHPRHDAAADDMPANGTAANNAGRDAGTAAGTGAGDALPIGSPPGSAPSADPTRPPACAQPNVAAATLEPVVPETPPMAQEQGISGIVTVLVSLDEQSRVTSARVVTSPSALLDDAAVRAARASRFRTEIRDCRSIAADYAFLVEFSAQ